MNEMNGVIYTLGLVFLAIAMFQGAATGKIHRARSKRYWTIPAWGRLLCLLIGSVCTAAVILVTVRYFSK